VLGLAGGGQEVGKLLVGGRGELGLGPQIGGEERVGLGQSVEGGLDEVSKSLGTSGGRGEAIVDSGVVQDLLGDLSGDNTGTTGSGDETHADGTTLSSHLHGDSVGLTDSVTPISSADRNNVDLGVNDGSTDSGSNFLGALDSESDVSVVVSDNDECLKAGALTGTGLLLDGHDLHDLILQLSSEEGVNDLVLLDGKREKINLLERLYLSRLDETSELGHGDPLSLSLVVSSTAGTTASSTTAITLSSAAITTTTTLSASSLSSASESASESAASCCSSSSISHVSLVD